MSIPSGSFTALMGPTGSGKSTLIQVLVGLLTPSKGEVQIGDTVYTAKQKLLSHIMGQIGLVLQFPESQLFEQTVEREIAFAARNLSLPETEVEQRVIQAMEQVGLSLRLRHQSPFQLSGGEKRRVAIASLLTMKPNVLILDEPTAGLDPPGQRQLLSMLSRLHQEQGLTILLVTHQSEEAFLYADHLIVMHEQTVVWEGSPKDLLQHPQQFADLGLELPPLAHLIDQLNQQLKSPIPLSLSSVDELIAHLRDRAKKVECQ
jgi:energy-coupling factor transport system ATP-binding protein